MVRPATRPSGKGILGAIAPGLRRAWSLAAVVAVGIACVSPPSHAGLGAPAASPPSPPSPGGPLPPVEEEAPADDAARAAIEPAGAAPAEPPTRYGQLERPACEKELVRRGIAFVRVDEAPGVLAPIRLAGALHGVTFHSGVPAASRATSPWEIVDCRLALALDDFAVLLAAHGVVEVLHYSMYRPPSKGWRADRIATRHPGGLAIDVASFVKSAGESLVVERDFHGRIGAATCAKGAGPHPSTPAAVELRQIVCDAVAARLFDVALTPDFNWAHRNHFHLEVTARPGAPYVH